MKELLLYSKQQCLVRADDSAAAAISRNISYICQSAELYMPSNEEQIQAVLNNNSR